MRNMTKRRRALMASSSSHQSRLPAGYQEVEWLRGSGTQYCETSYSAEFNSNFYQTIKGDITVNDRLNCNFAIADGWIALANPRVGVSCNSTYFYFYYGGTEGSEFKTISMAQFGVSPFDIHYELNATNVKANNIVIDKPLGGYASPHDAHFLIGAYKNAQGEITIMNENVNIKAFAIYDENNGITLISEFIPCYRKSDNKAGFYETGTETFLPNLALGSDWIIGPVV